jgi:hypothetical protein
VLSSAAHRVTDRPRVAGSGNAPGKAIERLPGREHGDTLHVAEGLDEVLTLRQREPGRPSVGTPEELVRPEDDMDRTQAGGLLQEAHVGREGRVETA